MAKYLIGYANSDERIEFAVQVRKGLEQAVANSPDFDLIWLDNVSDTSIAIANVGQFIEYPVDLAIIYHLDERMGLKLVYPLKEKRIPVISVEHVIPMTTFIGLDDAGLGKMAAEAVGQWVQENWNGQVDKVAILIDPHRFTGHLKRFSSAVSTLKEYADFSDNQVLYLDSTTQPGAVAERFSALLENWQDYHRIVVMTVSDEMTIPVLDAARAANREQDIAVMSGNGLQAAIEEFQKPFSRLIVSPAVYPEQYGEQLIDLARRMLNGEKVPPTNWVQPVLLSRENYGQLTPER